jgi:hypothetical protein
MLVFSDSMFGFLFFKQSRFDLAPWGLGDEEKRKKDVRDY